MIEILDLMECNLRKQEKEVKRSAIDNCQLAAVIIANISHYLNQEEKVVQPWDLYPELFKEEHEKYEQQQTEEQLEEYKLKRKAYAAAVNATRK